MDVFSMVAAERTTLADTLGTLTPEQAATPSQCTGWTVRDVAAHLTMPFHVKVPKLVWMMARNRFDFDRVADKFAKADTRTITQLADDIRANAEHRFTPPGFGPEAPLTDVVVHGQDIRRPLGIAHQIPEAHARTLLDFLVSEKGLKGFKRTGVLDGLSLEVDELDWRFGSGKSVAGGAEPMILALAARPAALDDLHGDGVDVLRNRL